MRFFKKTRWFEAYFEMSDGRILDRFYERRNEEGNHEFWIGRCYLAVYFYQAKITAKDTDRLTA